MAVLVDLLSWLLLLSGGFFVVVGSMGLVRMPDFFTRVHAASITDTLGANLEYMRYYDQDEEEISGVSVGLRSAF